MLLNGFQFQLHQIEPSRVYKCARGMHKNKYKRLVLHNYGANSCQSKYQRCKLNRINEGEMVNAAIVVHFHLFDHSIYAYSVSYSSFIHAIDLTLTRNDVRFAHFPWLTLATFGLQIVQIDTSHQKSSGFKCGKKK